MTRQNWTENRSVSLIREDLREGLAKAEASAVVLKKVLFIPGPANTGPGPGPLPRACLLQN